MEYFLTSALLLFFIFAIFAIFKKIKYSKLNNKKKAAGEISLINNIADLSKRHKRI